MIDLDKIEALAIAVRQGKTSWSFSVDDALTLIAEVRAWRAAAVTHRAFVDAFNASPDREGPEVDEAYNRMEEAQKATRPYEQEAIEAARGAK